MVDEAMVPLESVRRAMQLFVRAIAGPGFRILGGPPGAVRPFADGHDLYFPDAPAPGTRARTWYFAAAGHLAAHMRFGGPPFARGRLKAIPIVLVSLLEDARVELLLARELPGLSRLWREQHTAEPSDLPTFSGLLARIARALADPRYEDPHPLVIKARRFWAGHDSEPPPRDECRRFASILGNDVGQMRLPFDAGGYTVAPSYRDDHRLLWEPEGRAPELEERSDRSASEPNLLAEGAAGASESTPAVVDEATAEEASPDDGSGEKIIRYPEWDYQIRRARPAFCTVREFRVRSFPVAREIGCADRARDRQVERLARALRVEGRARQRRQPDGDGIDLDASIEARVDWMRRREVDSRVYVRTARSRNDLAVLLLIDLSASTAATVAETGARVIDLAREGARLVAGLLSAAHHSFAVHGFSSNGRHDVEYRRIKDFDERWDGEARARLAALAPQLSTRMGAALRHAASFLVGVHCDRRVILLLTDGEPSDIDVPDPDYLVHDAARAVHETLRRGIHVYAVSLDPFANRYVQRIFGAGRYRVLSRIERLPEVLPALCAHLSR
jgi:hypothetical protein